ncbi:MAG: DUF2975 domain-containing protein [Verrucomicrobia bacterium]|nr:DUF2975 domain-containing protein [Verrucomicrobiota bacterium]
MKRNSALFLQVAIVLFGVGALAFLLGEPHVEGRNAHATLFEIYFKDPFLAYVYVGSIPFFVALHRAFGVCGSVRQSGAFSPETLAGLQAIRRCAITIVGFVVGAVVIILAFGDKEDRPPGIVMSFLVAMGASAVAIVAAKLARKIKAGLA